LPPASGQTQSLFPRHQEVLRDQFKFEWLEAVNAEIKQLVDRGVIVRVDPDEKTPPAVK
jgi:hypothetical protein